uniref:AAA family ATPase n=1 Tax=Nonomuraea pusilla TaxID=46177 RepID=UPI0006E23DB2|nr:AAA family ATPase [Nonomuraea pusilla]
MADHADHPRRNPFPARGTSSAEETSFPDYLRDWALRTPTAPLPGVRGAVRLAEDYVREFTDEASRDGGLGCLHGHHGVGKTHAARHMMASVDQENPQAVQVYLKFQENDFVAAYRRLVSQLPQSLLTDLSLRHLGTLAGDRAGDERGVVLSELDDDPARLYDLFARHRVEAGKVLEDQALEIAAVTGDGPRFQRALAFLLRPEYSDAAYDWLCGRPISADAAYAIGVGGPIDDPLTCRYGLQLLAKLVTRAGRPFVLVLDQCEKFLLDDETPVAANVALLQSLVEMVPRAAGLLLLVTSAAGWDCMPPDLRQRVGSGAFLLQPLTPDEARLVVGAYIAAAGSPGAGIHPFTEDGLLELLRHSGGNTRLLLQLAWAAFAASTPGTAIDAAAVAGAAAGRADAPGPADLAMLVERALLSAGISAERVETPGTGTSFALPDRHRPRAVVRISEAVFMDDEVDNVVEAFAQVGQALSEGKAVFTALLVTGYVSPTVLAVLQGLMHRVLVADGSPAFARRMDELTEQLAAVVRGGEDGRDPLTLLETMRELRVYLEELSSERRLEGLALSRGLTHAIDPSSLREPRAATGWQGRRAELVALITAARRERATADWEEFRKARAAIVKSRRMWLQVAGAGALAALAQSAIGAGIGLFAQVSAPSVLVAAGVLVGAALAALAVRQAVRLGVSRAAARLESPRDLDLLARELRARPVASDAADPAARYAYALKEDPDEGYDRLADALQAEPLSMVRQAIARRMSVSSRSPAECVDEVSRARRGHAPEALLLLARRQRHTELDRPPRQLRELPPELRILVAIANPGVPELADGAATHHPAEAVLAALGVRGAAHPLARAYRYGVGDLALVELPPNELRAAARLLSPLDHEGLGTHDWLPVIGEIDELFLFFEELLYYQEEIRSHRNKS